MQASRRLGLSEVKDMVSSGENGRRQTERRVEVGWSYTTESVQREQSG